MRGKEAYDEMVQHVNTMLPRGYFYLVEAGLILGPLLFHTLYGVYVAWSGQANTGRYPYSTNWAYRFQRLTGLVAVVYLAVHVGVLRFWITLFGAHLARYTGAPGHLDLVTFNDVAAHLGNANLMAVSSAWAGTHIFVLYIIGVLASIYHFTNGLVGFSWTWGLAVGRVAQRRVQLVAWALFVALAVPSLNVLFTLRFAGV